MPRRPAPTSTAQLDPTPVPHVIFTRDIPAAALRRLVTGGEIVRVRRGGYLDAGVLEGLDEHQSRRTLALGRLAAVARHIGSDAVMSHTSAATLWGLPIVADTSQVHVRPPSNPSERSAGDVVRHVHDVPPRQITAHRGITTTTLERTVVDCAMTLPITSGLIIADAALHVGANLDECWRIVDERAGCRGVRAARAVLTYADDGAESSGETRTRLTLLRAGFPEPQTQVRVETRGGTFWADVGWPELRVLGEYDGEAKYTANGPAEEAVRKEKRRQKYLEEAGFTVFRVVNRDLDDVESLELRVRALARFGPVVERPELFPAPSRARHPDSRSH